MELEGKSQEENREEKAALSWMLTAGVFAVVLSFALFMVDEYLTHSPKERNLGSTLRQLRSAQTSLNSLPSDERLAE